MPIPFRPWSHLTMDFITDLPLSKGNTVILTVVDGFSKMSPACSSQAPKCYRSGKHFNYLGVPILQHPGRCGVRPGPSVYLPGVLSLLFRIEYYSQPYFCIPSPVKQPGREDESRSIQSFTTAVPRQTCQVGYTPFVHGILIEHPNEPYH